MVEGKVDEREKNSSALGMVRFGDTISYNKQYISYKETDYLVIFQNK